jgi:WD40 repeat protein
MRGALDAAALSPDQRTLAISCFEGEEVSRSVRLIDLANGRVVRTLKHPNQVISDLAFSPDGTRLAACGDRANPLWTWELNTQSVQEMRGFKGLVNRIAFAPGGQLLAAASDDQTVRVFSVSSGRSMATLEHRSPVRSLAFAPAPGPLQLATGEDSGAVQVFSLAQDGRATGSPRVLRALPNAILALTFAGRERLLCGQGERVADFRIPILRLDTGEVAGEFREHKNSVLSLTVSPDGAWCSSTDYNGTICVWKLQEPDRPAVRLASTAAVIQDLKWSREPGRFVLGWREGSDGPWRRFDLSAGAPGAAPLSTAQGALTVYKDRSLAIEPNRQFVTVSGGSESPLRLQLSEARRGLILPGGVTVAAGAEKDTTNALTTATFLPDGGIAVGSQFRLVVFSSAGKPVKELVGHTAELTQLTPSPEGQYLAAASADGTIRIYVLSGSSPTQAPLLSLFYDSRSRWVLWTEAGYFAASPGGDQLIGWQLNPSEYGVAPYVCANQYWQRLYRPDVLVRVLGTGSVPLAAEQADQARARAGIATLPAVTDVAAKLPPPLVQVVAPAEGTVTKEGTIQVRARITVPPGARIRRIYARANLLGARGQDWTRPGDGADTWTGPVTLQAGENQITVVAESEDGVLSAPAQTRVLCQPDRPLPRRLYLLAAGVSTYSSPEIKPLPLAAKDASDLAQTYQKLEGGFFLPGKRIVLTDPQATRTNILAAIQSLKEQRLEAQDYVVIYLAGHGAPVDPDGGDRDYCFLTQDASPGSFARTALPGRVLLDALQDIPCNLLLLLDTCRDGSAFTRADDPHLIMSYLSSQARYGRITIQSCGPGELSYEAPELGNGAFTLAFLRGIQGAAPSISGTPDVVTLADLESYLQNEVRRLTGSRQEPVVEIPAFVPLRKSAFLMGLRPTAATGGKP